MVTTYQSHRLERKQRPRTSPRRLPSPFIPPRSVLLSAAPSHRVLYSPSDGVWSRAVQGAAVVWRCSLLTSRGDSPTDIGSCKARRLDQQFGGSTGPDPPGSNGLWHYSAAFLIYFHPSKLAFFCLFVHALSIYRYPVWTNSMRILG
jgi:hypothetical protein